uniref:Uncharacterized protein n=1 Tax=Arundo donax TaxID=35708 RepID=A0A0A9EQ34_ARUDO
MLPNQTAQNSQIRSDERKVISS